MKEDFEFGDDLGLSRSEINPLRWDRAREIDHVTVLSEVLHKGIHGDVINCPMGYHRDSTPSFTIYRKSNSSFCFGCPAPASNQAYDNISFIAKYFEISKVKALEWLEKHYKLPRIADQWVHEEDEDEEEGPDTFYTVEDLEPMFLAVAPKLIESVEDARKVLKAYFIAQKEDDPLFLARILGRERIESINQKRTR